MKSALKIWQKISEPFEFNKELCQGCCISPTLFKMPQLHSCNGKEINGMGTQTDNSTCLSINQFAYDQVICANKEDIEYITCKLKRYNFLNRLSVAL